MMIDEGTKEDEQRRGSHSGEICIEHFAILGDHEINILLVCEHAIVSVVLITAMRHGSFTQA